MGRVAAGLAMVCLGASSAVAGEVIFDPQDIFGFSWERSASVEVNVVAEPGAIFDSVDVLLQLPALSGLAPLSFEFSPEFIQATEARGWEIVPDDFVACGVQNSCLFVGGLLANSRESIVLGTFSFATLGASLGKYELVVDPGDGISHLGLIGEQDPLAGSARVTVIVPEPAMIGIMAVMGLAVLRARAGRR